VLSFEERIARRLQVPEVPGQLKPVRLVEGSTVKEFAEKLGIKPKDVVTLLLQRGVFATINQALNDDVAHELERRVAKERAGEESRLARDPYARIFRQLDSRAHQADGVPLDDAKTYQIFQDGATFGIFQFESSGMRDILRKSKPQRLDDLIALNALYRPGPLRSGMVDDWIAHKQGRTEVKYELPQLEPILRETYGVIAYQEQVMRIARELGGFTLGEADILRKAMGKKNPEVMAKQRGKFVEGAKKNGIAEKLGYQTPADMIERYPQFFWSRVEKYIGDALRYLEMTMEGKQWIANLYCHIFAIEHNRRQIGPQPGPGQ